MQILDIVANEEARLNALRDLKLLDTPPSESFDRLTRLASQLLAAPVSTISLTDRDRQWFKSRFGVELVEIPREQAPCNYAIRDRGIFVVPDLKEDARFCDSPLAAAGIRFYAGAPLFTRAGHGLGTLCVVDVEPRSLTDEQGDVLRDLAGMVMAQVELQNMIGRVDATSGLPNQHQLFEDLEQRFSAEDGDVSAVLVEFMSQTHASRSLRVVGPACADDFVCKALSIVQGRIGNSSRLYHVGPMRGVVLLAETSLLDAPALADVLADALAAPIDCGGVPLVPDPAFGVAAFASGEVSPRDALRRLVGACEDARATEVSRATYSPARDEQNARSFRLLNDFSRALRADDELHLVYQPRVDIATKRHLGCEALLRWTHPDLGNIPPGDFVPLIEQTALIRPMTDWVAKTALAQLRAWRRDGLDFTVSINASALNLDERDFAGRFLRAIEDADVAPHDIELEFTESAVARDANRVVEQLHELRRNGIGIAIDDFGTGYSNLAYIQQLPVSVLKIDRSFMRMLPISQRDRVLVSTVITMAHDLGYRVVAEGIETTETLDVLAALGCDEGQGYLFSRPVSSAALQAWHREKLAA